MANIPSNLSRVPNMLASQFMLGNLTRTNQSLLNTQIQLATGKSFLRPSDNPMASNTISALDDIMERRTQRMRNLTHAEAVLNNLDAALADGSSLVLEAKSIGLSQIGVGSDADTRKQEAMVISSIIDQMIAIANRKFQDVHLFAGNATSKAPMQQLFGGVQYLGHGSGMHTDLGLHTSTPITVSAEQAFGAMSKRVEGSHDMQPAMIGQTRLVDLKGARDLGITLGPIEIDIDGTEISVDLTGSATAQDIVTRLQQAIEAVDGGVVVQIDPANGRGFTITPSAGVDITIADPLGQTAAADLGINTTFAGGVATTGGDVQPKLTQHTPLSSLSGVSLPLGTIRISNAGQTRLLDLSGAQNVQDIINTVDALKIGVRVEINEQADRLNFVNQLSGGQMSISEVEGGTTATELGIRSLSATTPLSAFNNGLGVQILSGAVDPQTGDPNPAGDLDFIITLKNGDEIKVDIAGATTVQDVLDAINAAAAGEGLDVPADFVAALAADGNGIALTDNTSGASDETSVRSLNGSYAARDLGIEGATTGATLTGQDRATVAVDSVISHLMALRDALLADDTAGISLATSKLEQDVDRFTLTRAETGSRTRRILDAMDREEDTQIQDMSLKSQLQDLDYTEAALRFSMLQQQLQAGLQSASMASSLSLLDFLR